MSARVGVVLMAYGTPSSRDAIESYYTEIRRGRPPTAEQLADLVRRYDAIGGTSPLAARTEAQRAALQHALDDRDTGRFEVVLGMKHSSPTIEAAVDELARRGVGSLVALVLAPHYSAGSIGEYLQRVQAAAHAHDLPLHAIESWATEPALVEFLATQVRSELASLPEHTKVVFTAHSLPVRVVAGGDPYEDEVRATASAVARAAGLAIWSGWSVAWQSAGRTPEPWLGPDVLEVIDELAASEHGEGLLVCACGFVADHLEVLYDLDIAASHRAAERGISFARTQCVNDDPAVIAALTQRVVDAATAGVDRVNHVAVVGGGITGLSAAWELAQIGARVTVLDAADRVGGRISTTPFAGLEAVDEGADAFLARVPFGRELAMELGLADDLVSPQPLGALVFHHGTLHPIPDGLVLGVPKGLTGLSRSGLLSTRGKTRAALDAVLPRTSLGDDSLGALVRARFGREVLERLVDPLVGSINAGDSDDLSLAAAVPQLAAVARTSRSLLLGLRRGPKPAPGPVFYAPPLGTGSLVDRLHGQLIARGVDVRTGSRCQELVEERPGVVIDGERFDGAIVATPAFAAADLLATASPAASEALRSIAYAGVVLVTVAVPDQQLASIRPASGYLVPKPEQRHVTAVSFASRKWAHLATPGQEVLRISLGHIHDQVPLSLDDDAVVRAALTEVGGHLGVELAPTDVRVSRWPRSFPQYEPHHLARVALIERVTADDLPSVRLAGAAYRGIGIPACIDQGRGAARALTSSLIGAQE